MSDFQIMASNDLRSGRVVYLTADGDWTDRFLLASRLTNDDEVAAAEERASQAVASDDVVDPYLVNVVDGDRPAHIRERIRHTGPTCLSPYTIDHDSLTDAASLAAG